MRFLDLTCPTPAENLACDEALLDQCELEATEVLRCWEPALPSAGSPYFVVVGCGNEVAREVNSPACAAAGVEILRRCSGGGTVLQGPGCLNYSVILQVARDPVLTTIGGTNRYVMARQQAAVEAAGLAAVSVRGHTDLASGERKFSGNAQRRKRRALLFHGTFLCHFDLARIEEFLRPPSRAPDYRLGRSHREFVMNLGLPAERLRQALRRVWGAETVLTAWPGAQTAELTAAKYTRADWNYKR